MIEGRSSVSQEYTQDPLETIVDLEGTETSVYIQEYTQDPLEPIVDSEGNETSVYAMEKGKEDGSVLYIDHDEDMLSRPVLPSLEQTPSHTLVMKSSSLDNQGELEVFTPGHSLQIPNDCIGETDTDEWREGAPVVISRFPSATIEISKIFWICLLFFVLCFLTILLLWVGLALLYVTYLVAMKFGLLHPQPSSSETSNTEDPSNCV